MRINYSNFTGSRYIYLPKFTANRNFKFIINCVPKHGTAWNTLLSKHSTDGDFGLKSDNYWYWNEINDNINYSPISNQRYWICLYWSGTQYFFYFMIDDDTYNIDTLPINDFTGWTLATSVNKNSNIYNNYELDLGNWNKGGDYGTDWPWLGSIDLYNTRIYADDSVWFDGPTQSVITNGYFNTGCFITESSCWINFNENNYIKLNNLIPNFTNFKIISKALSTSVSNNGALFCMNYGQECDIGIRGDGNRPSFYLNGWINGNTAIYNNVYYWWRVEYIDNEFKLYTIIDNNYEVNTLPSIENWDYQCSISTDIFTGYIINIGNDIYYSNEYWRGLINEFIIYIDNSEWFNLKTAVEGTDYSIVGSPTYLDRPNIAMNFSSSNYIKLNPIKPNFGTKQSFRVILRAYYTNPNHQYLLSRSSDYDRSIFVRNDNAIELFGGTDIYVGSLNPNNWYWIGYEWDGQYYTLYYMLDNGKYNSYKQLPSFSHNDWIKSTTFEDSTDIFSSGFTLGYNIPYNNSSRYWRGMIDLNNCIFGNNVINYDVGKEGYITQSNCKTIDQNTTDNITLVQGIKLTIVPDQADAKVILWANGYKQTPNTNTLTAVEGIEIHYEVHKIGYTSVSGSYILGNSDHTINITMIEAHDWIQPQIYDYGTWGAENTLSVKTDNGYHSDMYLWKAFNEDNDAGWHSSGTGTPFSVYISLGQPVYVSKMSFINRTNDPNSPWPARGGYLYGSNDGVNFSTIIATWTNDSALSAGQSWEFNVDNSQSWKYLKLYITNGSSYCCLKRIYITGEI